MRLTLALQLFDCIANLIDEHLESDSCRSACGESPRGRHYHRSLIYWLNGVVDPVAAFCDSRFGTWLGLVVVYGPALARLGSGSRSRPRQVAEARRAYWFDLAKRVAVRKD